MAVELGQLLEKTLLNLHPDHPDRSFLEKLHLEARDYIATNCAEVESHELGRFTEIQREYLIRHGYFIYQLTGKSLGEQEDNIRNVFTKSQVEVDFASVSTEPTEVAINLSNKSHQSLDTSYQIPIGTKQVIGEANQYVELAVLHFQKTGQGLFGSDQEQYEDWYWVKTESKIDPDSEKVLNVGFIWGQAMVGESYHNDKALTFPMVIPSI